MHYAADDAPIIDPVRAAPASRQQWLDPLPIRVVQPIELLPHQGLLDPEDLNHNSLQAGILIEYRP
jgi:hypothetical protein